jgi:hypothetical protein
MADVHRANSEPLIRNDETMRYRPLGNTGLMVSALSFGCMRLKDDQELNTGLISRAIDLGVNYFETTRGYLGGTCQHRTAPGLVGKTAGVIVSGKGALSADTTAYSFRAEIERQLSILGLTHFKFYQVGWFSWDMLPHLLKPGGALDSIRRAQDEGLIQHVGFTGHDTPENVIKLIETGLFDSATVPYNIIVRDYEPVIRRAGALGVGIVAMGPVGGGTLAFESQKLKGVLKMDLPTAAMALRFVLSNPDVSTACSGMNTMEQLGENVRTVREFDPSQAQFEEMCEGIDRLRESLGEGFCTACGYCMPCPQGVNIPRYMCTHNNWKAFGMEAAARDMLKSIAEEHSADRCNECGECEEKCPNSLPVRESLRELKALE